MISAASTPAGASAEPSFILRLLSVGGTPGVSADDAAGLDWAALVDFAFRHRLLPMVHAGLDAAGLDGMPTAARDAIRSDAMAISRNNLLLTGELVRIVRAFTAEGIAVLPFKGATLANRYYGSVALRFFTDNDILIREHDVPRAWRLLESLEYVPRPHLTPAQLPIYPRYEHDIGMMHRETKAHVELHWHLHDRSIAFPHVEREIWSRLRSEEIFGTPVAEMPPEELLVVLAVHGTKHAWSQLGWTLDIARVLAHEKGLDWDHVMMLAELARCKRSLLLALILASRLFDAPLPAPIAAACAADARAGALADEVLRMIFVENRDSIDGRPAQRFYLKSREHLRDRAHFLLHWAFTPNARDRVLIDLPESLSFLYYLVRPIGRVRRAILGKRGH